MTTESAIKSRYRLGVDVGGTHTDLVLLDTASGALMVEKVAVGGLAGGLLVCFAALLGDPLLDALDVSDPSFRLAAGIVALVAGAADLLRAAPSPEPALDGWKAALVPLAVPLVARPAPRGTARSTGPDASSAPASSRAASCSRSTESWRFRPTLG